jgi:4-hydroxy-2-oxoglutarate aldolase
MKSNFLQGVFPPMLTPFKERGDVDFDAHLFNLNKWNDFSLKGYLVLGSNSETVYLSENEKLELIKKTVEGKSKDKILLAGTGMESTLETIQLTNKAAALGVNAALILTPFYYKASMTTDALIQHFETIANHADIPILIYNVPKFTNINVSQEIIARLCQHPNIIGMKDSLGDNSQLEQFLKVVPEKFTVMSGTASSWYPGLKIGIKGAIMALANIAPADCIQIEEMVDSGNINEASRLHEKILPVNTAITATYGIAGLKYAAQIMGWKGGFVRKPLLELTYNQKIEIDQIITNYLKPTGT